jgi:hypothetical protein
MKDSIEKNEDILSKYMNPGNIERSPEGLSERIMMQVRFRNSTITKRISMWKKYSVPVITIFTIIVLTLLSSMHIPAMENNLVFPGISTLTDYNNLLQKSIAKYFMEISFPSLLTYIALGLFMLFVLDYILTQVFRRKQGMKSL